MVCEGYEKVCHARGTTDSAQYTSSCLNQSSRHAGAIFDSSSITNDTKQYHGQTSAAGPSTVLVVPHEHESQPVFLAVSPKSQYKLQLLHRLQQSCVPVVDGVVVCVSWIVTGCSQASRQDEGPLSDALLATAMRTVGSAHRDCQWDVNAFCLYQRALGKLRACLRKEPTGERQDLLALTSFACVMFEVRCQNRP